jgi:hypothetical protein
MNADDSTAPVNLAALAADRERRDRRQAGLVKRAMAELAAQWRQQPETIGPGLRAALVALVAEQPEGGQEP